MQIKNTRELVLRAQSHARTPCACAYAFTRQFHAGPLTVPQRTAWRPDRELLAERFERFASA